MAAVGYSNYVAPGRAETNSKLEYQIFKTLFTATMSKQFEYRLNHDVLNFVFLSFGPKIELIFILRGVQNGHECLFRISCLGFRASVLKMQSVTQLIKTCLISYNPGQL